MDASNKQINIYPPRLKQIAKVFGYVALTSISFEEEVANIELTLA